MMMMAQQTTKQPFNNQTFKSITRRHYMAIKTGRPPVTEALLSNLQEYYAKLHLIGKYSSLIVGLMRTTRMGTSSDTIFISKLGLSECLFHSISFNIHL